MYWHVHVGFQLYILTGQTLQHMCSVCARTAADMPSIVTRISGFCHLAIPSGKRANMREADETKDVRGGKKTVWTLFVP